MSQIIMDPAQNISWWWHKWFWIPLKIFHQGHVRNYFGFHSNVVNVGVLLVNQYTILSESFLTWLCFFGSGIQNHLWCHCETFWVGSKIICDATMKYFEQDAVICDVILKYFEWTPKSFLISPWNIFFEWAQKQFLTSHDCWALCLVLGTELSA